MVHCCMAVGAFSFTPHEQAVVDAVNATFGARAAGQLHYELMLPSIATNTTMDKERVAMMMMFGVNLMGFDRMMFGQYMLGALKLVLSVVSAYLVVFGGRPGLGGLLGIWAWVDH